MRILVLPGRRSFLQAGTTWRSPLALLVALFLSAPAWGVDYVRDVKPILRERCYACHGALRQKSGLRLDSAALIRKGGKGGPIVVPGKNAESPLVDAVLGRGRARMPPVKEGPPLTEKQIAVLQAWIDSGAKAPDERAPEDPRKHWAFQKPQRPALPQVRNSKFEVRNPIDAFIGAELERHGLQALPAAEREALLRRVTIDLTGLPPTRDELHAFLADDSADAYEKVVDRLLASPRYGERWGRHWMDIWRYSDWYGRRSVPDWWNSASQIWRWRDWIVKSLNGDKGYDRMVLEMLAADEICPDDDDALVATGYLARNWYALNPNQWMRDNVEHTGKAFLGLTFNCAHCHDHKYDPISQEEYFRFRAFFEPIDLRQDRVAGEPDPGPFQKYDYSKLRKPVRVGSIRVFDEHPDAKTVMYQLGDERHLFEGKPPVAPGAPAFLGGDKLTIAPVDLPASAYYPGLKSFIQHEETARRESAVATAKAALARTPADALAKSRLTAAEADLRSIQTRIAADNVRYGQAAGDGTALAKAASQAERAATVAALEDQLLQAEAALSAAKAKKEPAGISAAEAKLTAAKKAVDAARQTVSAASTTYTPLTPLYPKTSTGRRRALAQWIANKDNPLTARVAVNHIWMRHFGKPLVETVFDFGRNGKSPTHPELLDWLAVELMDNGWSMKHLHRLIVTSSTYREASAGATATAQTADPDNRWLWHFPSRRVEAEVVRDSILFAAGELDLAMGGLDIDPHTQGNSRRRSMYFTIYPEGGGLLDMLEFFDPPDPCDCYRRSDSLIPQQALVLTNSALIHEASRRLAGKLSAADGDFIVAAFEQVLARRPTQPERTACLEFLAKQMALYRGTMVKATENDLSRRARESLVRALFNHNDFVTIR